MAQPPHDILTPGKLFSLQPLGWGTAGIESLTGFLTRLARAHRIPVWVLVMRELVPFFHRTSITDGRGQCDLFAKPGASLNGLGGLAEETVDILQKLCGLQGLARLTLLPFKEIISPRSSIRSNRAWCPKCYQSWHRQGEPARDLLLWQIDVVRVCPFHPDQRLQTECFNCRSKQRPLARYSLPGICANCGVALCKGGTMAAPSLVDQALAAEARILIESINTQNHLPNLAFLRYNLQLIRQQVFKNSTLAFAKACGLHHSSANALVTGKSRPGLETILRISAASNVSAADLLSTKLVYFTGAPSAMGFKRKICQHYDWPHLQRRLKHLLKSGNPTASLHSVCRSEKVDPAYVAKRFPKLASPIIQNFRHHCSQRHSDRLAQEESSFRDVVEELVSSQQWPSHRKLKSQLHKPGMLRNPTLIRLRREILFSKQPL